MGPGALSPLPDTRVLGQPPGGDWTVAVKTAKVTYPVTRRIPKEPAGVSRRVFTVLSEIGTDLKQPMCPSHWTGLAECELSLTPRPKGTEPEPDRSTRPGNRENPEP